MPEAYIVDAVRTPVGKRGGSLAPIHPADLGAITLNALMDRTGIDPAAVEDVVMGCLDTIGPQAGDIARTAWLAAGLPETTPGVTVDRQCGSSQQAVHFAAQAVLAGVSDVVVAAGVQNMSMIPISSAMTVTEGMDVPEIFTGSEGWVKRYGDQEISQFRGADMIAEQWDITRDDMEAFAVESHERALRATAEGRFEREILPFPVNGGTVTTDQGIRADTSLEALAALKPVFREDGRITAGNSSQISDGAAAVMLASRERADELGLRPRARILDQTTVGVDPVTMLTGPIPATRKILDRNGMTIDDIDLFEVNEAYSSVIGAWRRELGPDMDRVNVNGGAIALGHPLGSTGARLVTTLLHELESSDKEIGLVTMCCGGGLGTGTLIQRV
jgi:acetyl-CoA C-acetyltransferase